MPAMVGLMGALIFLPLPFGNVLPAAALVFLGLCLVYRDGLPVLLAAGAGALASTYCVSVAVAAWVWVIAPLVA